MCCIVTGEIGVLLHNYSVMHCRQNRFKCCVNKSGCLHCFHCLMKNRWLLHMSNTQFCQSQWCQRLEFWYLIGRLQLSMLLPGVKDCLWSDWWNKQNYIAFAAKLQSEMASLSNNVINNDILQLCCQKIHILRSKIVEIRLTFQHSMIVSLQLIGVFELNTTTATNRICHHTHFLYLSYPCNLDHTFVW